MKTPKPILERRRSVRVPENLPFRLGHEDFEIEGMTLNVGAHGILCSVDKDLPLMTKVSIGLSLHLNGRPHAIRTKGVVVRKTRDPRGERFHVAIFFSDLKPKDADTLRDYIDQRLNA